MSDDHSDWVVELCKVMAQLRNPQGGCPWDLEQTHETLLEYLVEETHEFMDAVLSGNDAEMADELGDVLLQVVFHCQLAQETDRFDLQQVARTITEKLIRRHPHVFGDVDAKDAEVVLANWEKIKNEERGFVRSSSLDGVPATLPPIQRAVKLQKRAAKVGFDWPDSAGVFAKLREEIAEIEEAVAEDDAAGAREEVGDLMFTLINLSRKLKVDPTVALADANRKFESRFRSMETMAAEQETSLTEITDDARETLWGRAKSAE